MTFLDAMKSINRLARRPRPIRHVLRPHCFGWEEKAAVRTEAVNFSTSRCDFVRMGLPRSTIATFWSRRVLSLHMKRESGRVRGHGWRNRWRANVVCWAATHARQVPGDFVECGVNRGGNARMVIEYLGIDRCPEKFFLFDTFQGFVDEYLSEGERQNVLKHHTYSDCLSDVRQTFAPFPFVKIVPGAVPDTLDQVSINRVSFLSIDMNCAAPEIAAAAHFWPLLVPGAVIVLDDYGFSSHLEQKQAFDRFAEERNVPILSLPTGQALIFKA